MSDLEDKGYLHSPHTSAGRVPTAQGYRLFVDSLIELQPLPHEDMARLRRELPPQPTTTRDLLGNVSTLLSAMTHFAGVVTVPRNFPPLLVRGSSHVARRFKRDVLLVGLCAGHVCMIMDHGCAFCVLAPP